MKTVERLFHLSFICLVLSIVAYIGATITQLVQSANGAIQEPVLIAFAVMGAVISIFAMIILSVLRDWLKARAWRRNVRRRVPLIPLEPMPKEPGWNKAVLRWFFGGPELRQPNEDFSKGFKARAQVPPPKRGKNHGRSRTS